jgi:hypothetical protein
VQLAASTKAIKDQRAAEQKANGAMQAAEEVRTKFENKLKRLSKAIDELHTGATA